MGPSIGLIVALQVHPAGLNPPLDRVLPDRALHRAALVLEAAGAADAHREDRALL